MMRFVMMFFRDLLDRKFVLKLKTQYSTSKSNSVTDKMHRYELYLQMMVAK